MSRMLLSESIQMKATARWGNRVVLLAYVSSRPAVPAEWVQGFRSSDGLPDRRVGEAKATGFSRLGFRKEEEFGASPMSKSVP
jgi:hypothetical protein